MEKWAKLIFECILTWTQWKLFSVVIPISDGITIDADCKLENVHVHSQFAGYNYMAIMALVDIPKDKNSYHRMQLLVSDDEKRYEKKPWTFLYPNLFGKPIRHIREEYKKYVRFHEIKFILCFFSFWIFQKSGRIGTIIGKSEQQECNSIEHAEQQFRTIFQELTGNDFNPFAPFEKKPDKYQLLKIECEARKDVLKSLVPSHLEARKYGLMKLICDKKAMKDTMLSFDLDTTNMPLGKFPFKFQYSVKLWYQVHKIKNPFMSWS